MGTSSQSVGFVDQKINSLPSLQQTLNILAHNSSNIIDFSLNIGNRIFLASLRSSIIYHQFLQLAVEASCAIIWQAGKIRAFGCVLRQKPFLDLEEEAERYTPAEGGVCNYEIGESASGSRRWFIFGRSVGNVMDEVVVMGVSEFLGCFVLDFWEDKGGEG